LIGPGLIRTKSRSSEYLGAGFKYSLCNEELSLEDMSLIKALIGEGLSDSEIAEKFETHEVKIESS
jgi:hypothetical protein